jgi:hypothetical protein
MVDSQERRACSPNREVSSDSAPDHSRKTSPNDVGHMTRHPGLMGPSYRQGAFPAAATWRTRDGPGRSAVAKPRSVQRPSLAPLGQARR